MAVPMIWLWPALALGSAFLLTLYINAFLKRRRIVKEYSLPGPLPSIINVFWPFGIELELLKEQSSKDLSPGEALFRMIDSLTKRYAADGMFRIWFMFKPVMVLFRARTIEHILKHTVEINKSEEVALVETWLGKGLLTSNGGLWHQKRKMLTPVFHFNILEAFMATMNEQAAILTDIVLEKEHQPLDVGDYVTKCALDVICETAMGVAINAQRKDSEYTRSLGYISEGFIRRFQSPWLWSDFIYRLTPVGKLYFRHVEVAQGLTRKVIATRLEEMQKQSPKIDEALSNDSVGPKEKKPLMDLLLEKYLREKTLTLENIREEVDTFMFTGHDTTAAAVTWALYRIGLEPVVQAKIHDELDIVFGDDRTRPVTSEDLVNLKYLDCVMKETLRLYPSAPVVARRILNDLDIGEHRFSAGSSLFIDFYHTHRDPGMFPDPERFDPDRFLPENAANLNPFAYVPFSAGPRNCIGQKYAVREVKVILATVLRRLQIKTLSEKIDVMFEVILRPTKPILIEVRRRPKDNCDYFK